MWRICRKFLAYHNLLEINWLPATNWVFPGWSANLIPTTALAAIFLRLADNRTVEAVLMPEERRDTVCISSQVGCPVDCKFCLTALMGLERNLTAGEIVGQVLLRGP